MATSVSPERAETRYSSGWGVARGMARAVRRRVKRILFLLPSRHVHRSEHAAQRSGGLASRFVTCTDISSLLSTWFSRDSAVSGDVAGLFFPSSCSGGGRTVLTQEMMHGATQTGKTDYKNKMKKKWLKDPKMFRKDHGIQSKIVSSDVWILKTLHIL